METPPITQEEITNVEKRPLPLIVKILLWVISGLCATLSVVCKTLYDQNKRLYDQRYECQTDCNKAVLEAKEAERVRTYALGFYKDSIINGLRKEKDDLLQRRIEEMNKDINKLDKALKPPTP